MLARQPWPDSQARGRTGPSKREARRSRPRSQAEEGIVALDDRGNVIGTVRAPKNADVFGRGRGAVYLIRE